jgi:hypothetical protein
MTGVMERATPADVALGRVIHHYMWDRKITQTKMSAMTGIDQGELSKKINGKRRWWFHEMLAVADSLGIDAVDLLKELWGPSGRPESHGPNGDLSINFHGSSFYDAGGYEPRGNAALRAAA